MGGKFNDVFYVSLCAWREATEEHKIQAVAIGTIISYFKKPSFGKLFLSRHCRYGKIWQDGHPPIMPGQHW